MLLRPLSVILDDVRLDDKTQPCLHPIRELARLPPNACLYSNPFWSNYTSLHDVHCSIVARNEHLKEYCARTAENQAPRRWDSLFVIPKVEGLTTVEVVLCLKTWTLVRECFLMQLMDVLSPPKLDEVDARSASVLDFSREIGSDSCSVCFSEEIDTESASESEPSLDSPQNIRGQSRTFISKVHAISPKINLLSVPTPSSGSKDGVHKNSSIRAFPLSGGVGQEPFPALTDLPESKMPLTEDSFFKLRHSRETQEDIQDDKPRTVTGVTYSQMAVDTRVIPPSDSVPPSHSRQTPGAVDSSAPGAVDLIDDGAGDDGWVFC